nr:PREDICTED: uncharacterized protein LOC105673056 [Linepithema humile]
MSIANFKTKGTKKLTREAIFNLIEAYKEKICLYAINTSNYPTEPVQNEALKKVCATVSVFRPGITENKSNIENTKVKASLKSGAGTDVYKPNLWYFKHLKYLETYFTPRKSRNFKKKNSAKNLLTSTQELLKIRQLSQVILNECQINETEEIIEEEEEEEEENENVFRYYVI